jgi:ABC-2 type transport system ATP-binding protein
MDAITLTGVTKRFGDVAALDDVSVGFGRHLITGLVGRNGAGKSTLLDLVSARARATSGSVRVQGEDPFENRRVLAGVCAITENQPYPSRFSVETVLHGAALLHPRWDAQVADDLIEVFALRRRQKVGKLSRGQRSALGVVIALASRAPITLLDEPYVGLDAVARRVFYDRLLEDVVAAPRTVIFSSHLIDEIAHLLDHLVVLDRGRVVLAAPVDLVRDSVLEVSGPRVLVDAFVDGLDVLARADLAGVTRVTVRGAAPDEAALVGLRVRALPLQEVLVALTTHPVEATLAPVAGSVS